MVRRICAILLALSVVGLPMTIGQAEDRSQMRSMVISRGGIVAAESPLAAQAGAMVLARGGSAVDAAVAANAVMGVVAPMSNGIGGDLFAIVYDAKSGKLYGLNASGWAPAGLSAETLRARGNREMPQFGIASVTVPGAVDGWSKLLERFGRLKTSDDLAAAIRLAEEGFPVTEWVSAAWTDAAGTLRAEPNAVKTYLPAGRAPRPGEVFRNPELAASLRLIASGGRDAYYRGEIAAHILAVSQRLGGWITAADLAEYSSEWVEPISTSYRGWRVSEMPPNGQGIGALLMLNMMEQFNLTQFGLNSTRALHVQIEAKKLAYADVIRYIAEPKASKIPVSGLLSKPYAIERAKLINM